MHPKLLLLYVKKPQSSRLVTGRRSSFFAGDAHLAAPWFGQLRRAVPSLPSFSAAHSLLVPGLVRLHVAQMDSSVRLLCRSRARHVCVNAPEDIARDWHSAVYGCTLQLSCVLLLFPVCAAYIMSSQWPITDISSFVPYLHCLVHARYFLLMARWLSRF
jgi:hypothetical protein